MSFSGVLMVYLILTPSHHWEFMFAEPVESRAFCEMEAAEAEAMFKDEPGNMKLLCVDGEQVQITNGENHAGPHAAIFRVRSLAR